MEGELLPARGDGKDKPGDAEPIDQAERREVLLAHYEHTGPLPDQHWFRAVEQLHPGATGKLLDDFVADREHARTMESEKVALDRRNLDGFVMYQLRQQRWVGAIATLIVAGSIALIVAGLPVAGLALIIAELVSLVAVFLGRRLGGGTSPPSRTDEDAGADIDDARPTA
jgi:hypothetical protein